MSVLINGIDLGNVQWVDEFSAFRVAQTSKRTLDGGVVFFTGARVGGIPISLESREDTGWVKRAAVVALKLLFDTPGEIVTVNIRGEEFSCLFDHSGDGGAFTAAPLFPMANPTDEDYYRVKIKLITV